MLPQKIFKIRMPRLAENEFHTTKFPDFSLTFCVFFFKIPSLFLLALKFCDISMFSRSLDTLSLTLAAISDFKTKNVIAFVSRELRVRHSTHCPTNIADSR